MVDFVLAKSKVADKVVPFAGADRSAGGVID